MSNVKWQMSDIKWQNSVFLAFLLSCSLALVGGLCFAQEPPTSLKFSISDFALVKYGELDRIEVPEGRALITEEGRPDIPFLLKTQDYPAGYRVQAVLLKTKTGEQTKSGVKLPVVILDPTLTKEPAMVEGLYPDKDFDWQLNRLPTGGSQLVVAIYPFHYDPKALELKSYRDFEFDVKYVKTTIALEDIGFEKQVYDPGENIRAWLRLSNSGAPLPVSLVAAVFQAYFDGLVAELPEKKLSTVGKSDSVSLEWATGSTGAGDYILKVAVKSEAGDELDRQQAGFRIGNPGCEVLSFAAAPQQFKIGDAVKMSLRLKNTGSCPLSGQAMFEVRSPDSVVHTGQSEFKALAPGQSQEAFDEWNTASAWKAVRYEVLGYAAFAGTATLPWRIPVSTNTAPKPSFSFVPEKPASDQDVTFDASGSQDSDGQIIDYSWDFGDGGTDEGKQVKHAFTAPGDYSVTLKLKDNEGAEESLVQVVTVAK